MKTKCSKCNGPVQNSFINPKYWCRGCETYICEKCLKKGKICPSCKIKASNDPKRQIGSFLIGFAVIIGLIMMVFMFKFSSMDSLESYDLGETVHLSGTIDKTDEPVINGSGAPGAISWTYNDEFTFREERGEIKIVITEKTIIQPYYLKPEIDPKTGTYRYSYSSGEELKIKATIHEDENGERYYKASTISMNGISYTTDKFELNDIVRIRGHIRSDKTFALWGAGPPDNISWSHDGILVITDERGEIEIRLRNTTKIQTDGLEFRIDSDTGYKNYSIGNDDFLEVKCLVGTDDIEGIYLSALVISNYDPSQEEDSDASGTDYLEMIFFPLLIPTIFAAIGLVFIYMNVRRRRIHENNSIMTAALLSGKKTEIPHSSDFIWKVNKARLKYAKFTKIYLPIIVVFSTFCIVYFLYLKDERSLSGVILGLLIALIPAALVWGIIFYAFYNTVRTSPVRVGVSKDSIKVEYLEPMGGDSFNGGLWKDMESFEPMGGGRKIWVTLKNGSKLHIWEIDMELGQFLKDHYVDFMKKQRAIELDKRKDKLKSIGGKIKEKMLIDKKLISSGEVEPERIQWKDIFLDIRSTVALTILFYILFLAFILLPMGLLNVGRDYWPIVAIILAAPALLVTILIQRPQFRGYNKLGISQAGIHIGRVGSRLGNVPDFIAYENVKKINTTNGIDISTKDGYDIQLAMIPNKLSEWINQAYLDYKSGGQKHFHSDLSDFGIQWINNSIRAKARRAIILIGFVISFTILLTIFIIISNNFYDVTPVPLIVSLLLGYFYWTFVKIPVSLGTTSEGLFVKWSPRIKNRKKMLEKIAWKDVTEISETNPGSTPIGVSRARGLNIQDNLGVDYEINPIDDACANLVMKEWNKQKDSSE